jgi:hypothetical protein
LHLLIEFWKLIIYILNFIRVPTFNTLAKKSQQKTYYYLHNNHYISFNDKNILILNKIYSVWAFHYSTRYGLLWITTVKLLFCLWVENCGLDYESNLVFLVTRWSLKDCSGISKFFSNFLHNKIMFLPALVSKF